MKWIHNKISSVVSFVSVFLALIFISSYANTALCVSIKDISKTAEWTYKPDAKIAELLDDLQRRMTELMEQSRKTGDLFVYQQSQRVLLTLNQSRHILNEFLNDTIESVDDKADKFLGEIFNIGLELKPGLSKFEDIKDSAFLDVETILAPFGGERFLLKKIDGVAFTPDIAVDYRTTIHATYLGVRGDASSFMNVRWKDGSPIQWTVDTSVLNKLTLKWNKDQISKIFKDDEIIYKNIEIDVTLIKTNASKNAIERFFCSLHLCNSPKEEKYTIPLEIIFYPRKVYDVKISYELPKVVKSVEGEKVFVDIVGAAPVAVGTYQVANPVQVAGSPMPGQRVISSCAGEILLPIEDAGTSQRSGAKTSYDWSVYNNGAMVVVRVGWSDSKYTARMKTECYVHSYKIDGSYLHTSDFKPVFLRSVLEWKIPKEAQNIKLEIKAPWGPNSEIVVPHGVLPVAMSSYAKIIFRDDSVSGDIKTIRYEVRRD